MSNITFKVGDRVKIINASAIESYELNKIGTIVRIRTYDGDWTTYVVDMGRPRRPSCSQDDDTCWYLQEKMIELVNKPNEQLLFEFMKEQNYGKFKQTGTYSKVRRHPTGNME